MSIRATDNLSLLAALAPLRTTPDNNSVQQDRGFSDRLDKAISGEASETTASEKARAMAESLTLQMLQTSLSLSGDGPSDSTPQQSFSNPLSSASSLIQAYRSNLPESAEEHFPPANPSSSRLQDLPTVTAPQAEAPSSHSGTAWLDSIIAKASRRYGVDVGLIKAVIKAESNFNPQAVSHAGARGLMQLMPATARSLGVNDSFDPEQNVMAGTRFLGDMLQRYDGNIDSALAAYNWGPGNVDKRPDRLPRETRDYQARVKQLYSSYRG
ncbi:MAG: transglycosylase SLT domain-containing protein [Steroidobacteraceae bacterium]|nr:transglycosylase SLT domain-containing protein [Deltaproteobacteria bacterium]